MTPHRPMSPVLTEHTAHPLTEMCQSGGMGVVLWYNPVPTVPGTQQATYK